jgi:hypothetical protein
VGCLNYCCLTTNGENYATEVKEGVAPLALPYIQMDIETIKNIVDQIILFFHWGEENNHFPTPDQIAIAHESIDLGASAVIGTHPHVIQGIEEYHGGIIAYSLGNFFTADLEYSVIRKGKEEKKNIKRTSQNKESIGLELTVLKDGININEIYAIRLDQFFLPHLVEIESLNPKFSMLNKEIVKFCNLNRDFLKSIEALEIKQFFNGSVYQNRYMYKTIDQINRKISKNIRFRVFNSFA